METDTSILGERLVRIGRIRAAHGVRGEIKVQAYTENILQYKTWLIRREELWQSFTMMRSHRSPTTTIVQLSEIDTRDQALALVGSPIAISEKSLQPLDNAEFYWYQLVGLEVYHNESERIGTVIGMLETGANDVLRVTADNQKAEVLIPYTDPVIRSIDLSEQRIDVDWEWYADNSL